mmetsp:Transcript_13134/g.39694  ORF Transcript_13134/g.39694 Transcript_13134/m.39694 type:complete len:223 (+) Transcript_13134:510-1178(+)
MWQQFFFTEKKSSRGLFSFYYSGKEEEDGRERMTKEGLGLDVPLGDLGLGDPAVDGFGDLEALLAVFERRLVDDEADRVLGDDLDLVGVEFLVFSDDGALFPGDAPERDARCGDFQSLFRQRRARLGPAHRRVDPAALLRALQTPDHLVVRIEGLRVGLDDVADAEFADALRVHARRSVKYTALLAHHPLVLEPLRKRLPRHLVRHLGVRAVGVVASQKIRW